MRPLLPADCPYCDRYPCRCPQPADADDPDRSEPDREWAPWWWASAANA